MKLCKKPTSEPIVKALVASRMRFGGGVDWVLNEFPKQLHACRQRQKRAQTQLIVLVDADNFSVEDRHRQLCERLKPAGLEGFGKNEPAVLLIPKHHIETWLCALLGVPVNEDENCKRKKKLKKEDFRKAAETLYDWSRATTPGPTCVPSLAAALPEWRKIG